MKNTLLFFLSLFTYTLNAQDLSTSGWHIQRKDIDPNNYYGVTVANGMVGLVSSPEPMKVKDVVLNGVYDYYQRGRVSNILKTFSHMNMHLEVDGRRIGRKDISNYAQIFQEVDTLNLSPSISQVCSQDTDFFDLCLG